MSITSRSTKFIRQWFLTIDSNVNQRIDPDDTADMIEKILNDPKGWIRLGYRFLRLPVSIGKKLRQDPDNWPNVFHIRISSNCTIQKECGFSGLSCADFNNTTIYLNDGIKQICSELNIGYFNQYDLYVDKDGYLDLEKSDKIVHAWKTLELEVYITKYFNL